MARDLAPVDSGGYQLPAGTHVALLLAEAEVSVEAAGYPSPQLGLATGFEGEEYERALADAAERVKALLSEWSGRALTVRATDLRGDARAWATSKLTGDRHLDARVRFRVTPDERVTLLPLAGSR